MRGVTSYMLLWHVRVMDRFLINKANLWSKASWEWGVNLLCVCEWGPVSVHTYNLSMRPGTHAYSLSIKPSVHAYNLSMRPSVHTYNLSMRPSIHAYNLSMWPGTHEYNFMSSLRCKFHGFFSLKNRDTEVGLGTIVIVQRTQGDLICWQEDTKDQSQDVANKYITVSLILD